MIDRTRTVLALGTAQTLAWASSYYLPAVLAAAMALELGVGRPTVFAMFSAALLVSAMVGPLAGRFIDQRGGRPVLLVSNAAFALGLAAMGLAQGPISLALAWIVLGLAMGCGLYDAAFASLVRLYGRDLRSVITGITLLAGFASTVGWPLSSLLEAHFGWRNTCFVWSGLHLLVGLPLNAMLPRLLKPADSSPSPSPVQASALGSEPAMSPAQYLRTAALLATLFAMLGFVSTALAAHLPALLQAAGASLTVAVLAGSLMGPAQVAARLLEFGAMGRFSALLSARLAALAHPVGALLLLSAGPMAALPIAVLHGGGNGLLTIVRGTLPLALFGAAGYGARQGWVALPGRLLGALSPWLFGLVIARWGAGALWLSAAMRLISLACLPALQLPRPAPATSQVAPSSRT